MDTEHSARSDQDLAVEFLARKTHLPVGDVEQLYVSEMAKLAVGAHIKSFLSIFAIRNVRRFGKTLGFAYDGSGNLQSMTDPAGNAIGYGYTSGRLTSVTYPDGAGGDPPETRQAETGRDTGGWPSQT
jgi:YD repeat-containing protein